MATSIKSDEIYRSRRHFSYFFNSNTMSFFRNRRSLPPRREGASESADQEKKASLLVSIILVLVIGLLAIAIIDANYRPIFADLTKMGVAGYIGWAVPKEHRPS